MGRGAIVIGLAAVIIGEVVFGKLFIELRPSGCCAVVHRRDHLLHRAAGRAAAWPEHQRPQARHGADRGGVPRHSVLEGQGVPRQGTEGRQRTMLELKNICKTFNPGTVNAKTALNDLNLTLERRRFRHRHRRQRRGQVHHAQRHRGRVSGGLAAPSSSTGRTSPSLPEHKRAALLGRVFQDPMMGTAADHADRGESGARRPPRAAPRPQVGHHQGWSARTTRSCCVPSTSVWRTA